MLSTLIACLAVGTVAQAQTQPFRSIHDVPESYGAHSMFGLNALSGFHLWDNPNRQEILAKRMTLLKESGAKWDRFDFWWSLIEPEPGKWDFALADEVVNLYHENGIGMMPILSYTARWLDGPPLTDEQIADYAEYVEAVVSRYKDRIKYWEVWNEPNIPTFWAKPDAAAYTRLLKAAYAAAKRADPECVVIAGAVSMSDHAFFARVAELGGLEHMDAWSFHPYSLGGGPLEMGLFAQIRNLKRLTARYGRPDLPLFITEMGFQAPAGDVAREREQANWLLQSYLIAKLAGVQRVFWFNLQSFKAGDHIEGWGLVETEFERKKSLEAYKLAVRMLEGVEDVRATAPVGWLPTGSEPPPGVNFHFERDGKGVLAMIVEGEGALPVPGHYSGEGVTFDGPVRPTGGKLSGPVVAFFEAGEPAVGDVHGALVRPALGDPGVTNPFMWDIDGDRPRGWLRGMFSGGEGQEGELNVVHFEGKNWAGLAKTKVAYWQSYPVPVSPGESVRVSAEARLQEATGETFIELAFMAGTDWQVVKRVQGGPRSGTLTDRLSAQAVVPEGSSYLRIHLRSDNNEGQALFRAVGIDFTPKGAAARLGAVLIHGAGGGAWEWAPWTAPLLMAGVQPVAPEVTPFEGVAAMRLQDYVERVVQSANGLARPALVGASMGGALAVLAAPMVKPSAIVLINPVPPASMGWKRPPVEGAVMRWKDGPWADTVAAMPDSAEWMQRWAHRRWRDESSEVLRALRDYEAERPKVPMLMVISGADSDIPPNLMRRWADEWGMDVLEYSGMSHVGPLLGAGAPQVARDVCDWLHANVRR